MAKVNSINKLREILSSYKALTVVTVSTLVGSSIGGYIGYERGYVEGVINGSEVGYELAHTTIISGKIAYEVSKLRGDAKPLSKVFCDSYKATLPCKSPEDAQHFLTSSNPVERMRGQTCQVALQNLQNCGT